MSSSHRARCLVILASLTSAALLTTTAVAQDIWPTRGWPVAKPEDEGMDSGDLVVVFNGGGVNTDELAPFLFKAIQSDAPLPANENSASRLRKALDEARQPPPLRTPDPLPPLARSVSGRRYVMERNLLNLPRFSLTFSGPNEAHATIVMDNREWPLSIGLDGRYRFSSIGSEGLRVATRGQWLSAREFLLDVNTVANINHFTFRMQFLKRRVEVQVDEATGEVKNLHVRGQVESDRP